MRHEDEDVLGPLVHAQRLHPRAQARAGRLEDAHLARPSARTLRSRPGRAVHHHRPAGLAPQRQIHLSIPRVVELGVRLLQPRQLARAREVHRAVAGVHLGEEAQVGGHRLGHAPVRRRGQHQPPAPRLLLGEEGQQRLAVGQARGVQLHPPGHLRLEGRLALEQPQRRQHQQQRVALEQPSRPSCSVSVRTSVPSSSTTSGTSEAEAAAGEAEGITEAPQGSAGPRTGSIFTWGAAGPTQREGSGRAHSGWARISVCSGRRRMGWVLAMREARVVQEALHLGGRVRRRLRGEEVVQADEGRGARLGSPPPRAGTPGRRACPWAPARCAPGAAAPRSARATGGASPGTGAPRHTGRPAPP